MGNAHRAYWWPWGKAYRAYWWPPVIWGTIWNIRIGNAPGHISNHSECPQGMSLQGKSSLKKKGLRVPTGHWSLLGMPTGHMGKGIATGQNGKCPQGILVAMVKPSEPSSINNIISQLENCIEDIRAWMKLNLLKLNDDKTEMLVITYRPSTSQSLNISVKVGDQYINPSDEPPKKLGVIFDSTCSLKDHVANVCRSINFNLYSIGKIRKYLDRPTVEKLVNATITSRLDYCNSLMFGIPKDLMSQLQKRQNHAARVITQWRKYDHITPDLVDLHWLPVKQRIDFKILLLTYKALNGLAPAYIRELLTLYTPARTLRSMDNNLLEPPKCRLEYFGKRSFAAAAPVLWNDLPLHIKQSPSVDIFKSRIKTRLFQLAYFIWLCKCMYVYFMLSIMNRLGLTRSYVTCTFASALVSKGQISIWHICLILKLALYKYHIIILLVLWGKAHRAYWWPQVIWGTIWNIRIGNAHRAYKQPLGMPAGHVMAG